MVDPIVLGIGGAFTVAILVGVGILARGAPSKDATQSDYPNVYQPSQGGSKKPKNKTKRRK